MAASKVKTKGLNITGTPAAGKVISYTSSDSMAWVDQTSTSGFVPDSRTVNGHALTSDVTVSKSDVGLGNVPNLSFSGSNTGDETATSIETKLSVSATNVTALGNLTGTNTGDETQSTIKTKLGAATNSVDGYLTAADHTTFAAKQSALTNPITGTGAATDIAIFSGTSAIGGDGKLTVDYTLETNTRSALELKSPNSSKNIKMTVDQLWNIGSIYTDANALELWSNGNKAFTLDSAQNGIFEKRLYLQTHSNIDPDNKAQLQINLPIDGSENGIYVKGMDYLFQVDTYSGSATVFGFLYSGTRERDVNLNATQLERYSYTGGSVVLFDPTGLTINGTLRTTGHSGFGNTSGIDGGEMGSETMRIGETITDSGGYCSLENIVNVADTGDNTSGEVYAFRNHVYITDPYIHTSRICGTRTRVGIGGDGAKGEVIGEISRISNEGSACDVDSAIGFYTDCYFDGTGTVNNYYNYKTYVEGACAFNNLYGYYAALPNAWGTVDMLYGMYIEDHSSLSGSGGTIGTDSFNIYSAGADAKNRFEGDISIANADGLRGVILTDRTTPTDKYRLYVDGGTLQIELV